jgi:hypothetical protein
LLGSILHLFGQIGEDIYKYVLVSRRLVQWCPG